MQRLLLTFRKEIEARFLSHLDLLATLEYAMRRAHLPLALAEGFNPRPRMSLALPLPVGYLGRRELLEITLRDPRLPDDVRRAMNAALPPGIVIVSARETDAQRRHAASRVTSAVYRIRLSNSVPDLAERVDALLARERVEIEEAREKGVRKRDIRPFILGLRVIGSYTALALSSRVEGGAGIRPEDVIAQLGLPADGTVIIREWIGVAP